MKILCLSVHPVLEYDETRVLERLGHDVFSLGFYFHRTTAGNLRPPLPETEWHRDCRAAFEASGCSNRVGRWVLTESFCERFDLVLVHHSYTFIEDNWDAIARKPVVWRTIGQELHWAEDRMRPFRDRGLKIVRWSPEEEFIERYIGADAVIRTAKLLEDWQGWTGSTKRVVTFNNNFKARGSGMSFEFHQACVEGLPFDLYGIGNDDNAAWRGLVSAQRQQELLREHCVAFVTGTYPAPYTLGFIEAWMTGTPVVHVGRRQFAGEARGVYEIDHLIKHGETGFLVDDIETARATLQTLLAEPALCRQVSAAGRAAAIEVFGWDRAAAEWDAFLTTKLQA